MIDKTLLKQILLDNRKEIESYKIVHRDIVTEGFNCYVFVGGNAILECHIEMTGKDNPMLFLDEIHNISGWEKFARRMADNKTYLDYGFKCQDAILKYCHVSEE